MRTWIKGVNMRLTLFGISAGLIGIYAVGHVYDLPLDILTNVITKYCILFFLICYILTKVF